jgi:hypothetical protein
LEVPEFARSLAHAEELTLVGLTEGVAAGTIFRWGLFAWSGYDRSNELAAHPFQIGATVTAGGSLRHAPHTNLGNFLLESRLAIGYGYTTVTPAVVSGLVSATLLIKTVGM